MRKLLLVSLVCLSLFACEKNNVKENIKDGMVIAATATAMEMCKAKDMAAVKKDFDTWISKALKIEEVNSQVAKAVNKSVAPAICRTVMDIVILSYIPYGGMVPLEWKAEIDCMGMLKEKIAKETCDKI